MVHTLKSLISSQINSRLIVSAIVIMVFASYGLSLNNGFVWDDETFIVNNTYVYDISKWPLYFTHSDTISDHPVLSRMYRPIQTLSFALDAVLWKTWAGGFHLTSILLHLATCFAIFFAFAPLIGRRTSIIAATLFSVHPALSEGVLSLASRGNQLYTLFALLSLGLFIRTAKPLDKYHLTSLIMGLLALFSKEPAIAYIALLPLIQCAFKKPWSIGSSQSVQLYAPVFVIAGFYLLTRSTVVESAQVMPFWGGSFGATVLLQAKVFIVYLKLLFWPFHLQGRYTVGEVDLLTVIAMVANIILIIIAIFAWRRSHKGKLLALVIAWFYLSLAPVSNLIPLPGAMMGERFLYFTFAGMIPLILASIDEHVWGRYLKQITAITLVLFASFIFTNINRTMVWKNNTSYFTLLAQQEPNNPVILIRMAQVELEAGKTSAALLRLENLIKSGYSTTSVSDSAAVNYWYGKALLQSNRPVEAFDQFSQAAAIGARHSQDLVLLQAEAAARSNNLGAARTLLENEIESTPEESKLWNSLGNVLIMSGDIRGAVSAYTKAIQLDPSNREAAINLENSLMGMNGGS